MDKLKDIFDSHTGRVVLAAAAPWAASAANWEMMFKLIAGAGAAFYIWRKIIRNKD
jgi:hypothetical protein